MSKWNRPCRLKKEARPFFKDEVATSVMNFDEWKQYQVDENALEEVEEVFVTYGVRNYSSVTDDGTIEQRGGWCNPDNDEYKKNKKAGATFNFAIHFPSCKWEDHDKFMKGRMIAGLMDRIQRTADNYFTQFISEKIDENGNDK